MKLCGDIKHCCALRQPSTVTPFDNEKPHTLASHAKVGRVTEVWKSTTANYNIIHYQKHELFTEQMNKIALSSDDDKQIILPDPQNTFARGHWHVSTLRQNLDTDWQCNREGKLRTEESWGRQGNLGNRGQRSERVLVTSSTVGHFNDTLDW